MNLATLQALQNSGKFRVSPHDRDDLRVVRCGASGESPVDYFFYRDVFEELAFAADYDEEREAFAVLTGGFGVGDGRGFVEVTGFEHLTYPLEDDDLYRALRRGCDEIQQTDDGELIVGLFASVPGCDGMIADHVVRLHLSLFNIPFQPLCIVDPNSRTWVTYGRATRRTFVDAPLFVVTHADLPDPDELDHLEARG